MPCQQVDLPILTQKEDVLPSVGVRNEGAFLPCVIAVVRYLPIETDHPAAHVGEHELFDPGGNVGCLSGFGNHYGYLPHVRVGESELLVTIQPTDN